MKQTIFLIIVIGVVIIGFGSIYTLDEAEQDQKFLTDLWTACIVIVVGAIIARIAFQIVKKRMKKSD